MTAKIAKSAAGLIVEDAKFWVVEPRVTLSGVSGLGTLLSGNYIGFEVGKSTTKRAQRSTGSRRRRSSRAVSRAGNSSLKADNLGSLGIGSPIYYRRLQAGQVVAYDLAADGKAVDLTIFVNAPYDQYVARHPLLERERRRRLARRGGVDVRTQSLVSLIAGGLAFETPSFVVDARARRRGHRLHALRRPGDRDEAAETIAARYVLYFNESLRGLSVGAPVTLLGLPAGEVTAVGLDFDPTTLNVRGRVEIVSHPERLIARLSDQTRRPRPRSSGRARSERHAVFQRLIEQRGLRAQLRSGNLLTGQLYVALDFFPNAPRRRSTSTRRCRSCRSSRARSRTSRRN